MTNESELIIECTDSMLESYRLYRETGNLEVLPGNWKNDPDFLESLQQAEDSGLKLVAGYTDDDEPKPFEESPHPNSFDAVKVEFESYLDKALAEEEPKTFAVRSDEILVPLWPHTNTFSTKKDEYAKRVAIGFLIVWMGATLWHYAKFVNGGTYYFFQTIIAALLWLYALSQGTTHLAFDPTGIEFQSRFAGNKSKRRHIPWNNLADVFLEQSNTGSLLNWSLNLTEKSGKTHKIQLSKIANREQWHNVVDALNRWCPVQCRGVDREIFDSLSLNRQDPTYTALWLQALSAPPKRERLQPLIHGASLQSGKYVVTKVLGAGGQGTAYLARTKDDKQVVLKEYILPVFVDAKVRREAIDTFKHETEMLKRVHSPLIVSLEEAFVEDNRAYLVLEYVDGPSLKSAVLQRGIMEEKEAVKHALKMCDMLNHLHSLKPAVVHRDFTPDNLILTSGEELKLIDFMVAQEGNDGLGGIAVGKQAFMPPEQLRGKATICSDIYALGGTIFYMLTGQYPEAISQSRPSLFNEKVSVELDDIVNKCTALDCSARYQNANEVKKDLERCLLESVSL